MTPISDRAYFQDDLTRLRNQVASLKQENDLYRSVFNNVTQSYILMGLDGVIRSFNEIANQRAITLFGRPLYTGLPFEDFVEPEARENFREHFRAAMGGETVRLDYELPSVEGGMLWFEIYYLPVRNPQNDIVGVCLTAMDITTRVQHQSWRRIWEAAVGASNDGISIADASQRGFPLVYVNPAFEQITGYSATEVLGQNCHFLQRGDSEQPGVFKMNHALANGLSCRVIVRNYRKDGSLFWNEVVVYPIRNLSGQITHFVGTQRDVTQSKQFQTGLDLLLNLLGTKLIFSTDKTKIVSQAFDVAQRLFEFHLLEYVEYNPKTKQFESLYSVAGEQVPLDGTPLQIQVAFKHFVFGQLIFMPALHKPLTETDQHLLHTLADQMAVALENSKLHNSLDQRLREQIAVRQAVETLSSTLDLQEVLRRLMEQIGLMLDTAGGLVGDFAR